MRGQGIREWIDVFTLRSERKKVVLFYINKNIRALEFSQRKALVPFGRIISIACKNIVAHFGLNPNLIIL